MASHKSTAPSSLSLFCLRRHFNSQLLLLLFITLVIFLDVSNAALTPTPQNLPFLLSPRENTRDADDNPQPPNCNIAGDTDLYGLGVRLGIYFQQLSSLASNTLLPSEISGSLSANSIFLFALLLSILQGSIAGTLRVVDAMVMLQLCFSYFFSVLSLFGYRTVLYRPGRKGEGGEGVVNGLGGFGTYFRLFLTAATAGYSVWFWGWGIHSLEQFHEGDAGLAVGKEGCESLIWFFGTWKVLGGFRWLMQIGAVMAVVYFGGLFLVAFVTLGIWLGATLWEFCTGRWGNRRGGGGVKTLWGGMRREWRTSKNLTAMKGKGRLERVSTGEQRAIARHAHLTLSILNLIVFIIGMILVEFDLNVNHVQGVLAGSPNIYTPGQQLPLTIGGFSFLRVMWLIWVEWLKGGGEETNDNAIPLTPNTPGTIGTASTVVDDDDDDDGFQHGDQKKPSASTVTSPRTPATFSEPPETPTMTDRLQSERNIVFALAGELLPWLFSLEFIKGLVSDAANVHNGADANVILMRRKARSVRHPSDRRHGVDEEGGGTEYQGSAGGGYGRV